MSSSSDTSSHNKFRFHKAPGISTTSLFPTRKEDLVRNNIHGNTFADNTYNVNIEKGVPNSQICTLVDDDLKRTAIQFNIPSIIHLHLPSSSERVNSSRKYDYCMYEEFLVADLRLPLPPCIISLLNALNLAPIIVIIIITIITIIIITTTTTTTTITKTITIVTTITVTTTAIAIVVVIIINIIMIIIVT